MHVREMTNNLQLIKGYYFIWNVAKNLLKCQYLLNILSPKIELKIHLKPEFKACTMSHYISLFDEMLFSCKFSTTSSAIFGTIVRDVKNLCISNFLKNYYSGNYCYTRDLTTLLHFKIKSVLSIAEDFRNIHFLPHFHYFHQWMGFAIFQINTKFLINLLKYIFTKDTLHLSFISQINRSFSEISRNTHFLPPFF